MVDKTKIAKDTRAKVADARALLSPILEQDKSTSRKLHERLAAMRVDGALDEVEFYLGQLEALVSEED